MLWKFIKLIILTSFIQLSNAQFLICQNIDLSTIDSLKIELKNSHHDTVAVKILNDIAFKYHRVETDSALLYINKGYQLAIKIDYKLGIAKTLGTLGIIHYIKSENKIALAYFDKALSINTHLNNQSGIARINNCLGVLHRVASNYPEAIKAYSNALRIYQEIDNKKGVSILYNNIGIIYKNIGAYDSAFSYYYKSAELRRALGDEKGLSFAYNNIGNLKTLLKEYESAEEYLQKALKVKTKMNDVKGMGHSNLNLSNLKYNQGMNEEAKVYLTRALKNYTHLKDKNGIANANNQYGLIEIEEKHYDSALASLEKSLQLKKDIGSKDGIVNVLLNIATCYNQKGDTDLALEKAKYALSIAKEINTKPLIKNALNMLQQLNYKLGNSKKAYDYLVSYSQYVDSMYIEQKIIDLVSTESKFKLYQVQKAYELLQTKHDIHDHKIEQSKLELSSQKTILIAMFVCLLFGVTAAIFWYLFTQKKHKDINVLMGLNNEISQQNNKIELQALELKKTNEIVKNLNDSLELSVKERTEKIQNKNKILRDYAFANSHEVRAPLANLLGLINVSCIDDITNEERTIINQHINDSIIKLDSVITRVNKLTQGTKD